MRGLARYEDAESAYRRAIEINPKSTDARNLLGYLYFGHLVRYEDAEAVWRKAIEIDSGNTDAWTFLGNLFLHVYGDCQAAALLDYACCHPDREDPEAAWGRLAGALASHDERYGMLDNLHLLAGFRPDACGAARVFARRLLDPAPELTARCKDVPAPAYMWERFRPFVEGRSQGAGDPADGFCAGTPEPSG